MEQNQTKKWYDDKFVVFLLLVFFFPVGLYAIWKSKTGVPKTGVPKTKEGIMAFNYKTASKEELKKEYDRIAKEMGDDQFFTKKELNYLPEVLRDGEQILAFTSGLMDGSTWLITLTDRRIIFLDKGMFFGLTQSAIHLDKVNAVSGSTGIFFGKISIEDGAKERVIENVWKQTVKNFTNKVQDAIEVRKNNNFQSVSSAPATENPYEKLEKLASLKEKGIISEDEFEKEKKKILG